MGRQRTNRGRAGRAALGVLAPILAVGLLAAACSSDPTSAPSQPSPPGSARPDSELRFGLPTVADSLDPTTSRWTTEQYQIARAVYDPVVFYDESYVPKPFLAESVSPNADFTEWRITVRDGVRFHDGTPLSAEALRSQLDAARNSPGIDGALAPIRAVEVTGPRTVTVRMSTPWSVFPHVLASQIGFVALPSTLGTNPPAKPVGTGPFTVEEWAANDHAFVGRNRGYWQQGQPLVDRVRFSAVADSMARLRAVRAGQLDVALIREPDAESRALHLAAEPGGQGTPVQVLTDLSGETPEVVVALQSAAPPFVNAAARQAVAFGVDREAVAKRVFGGACPPADGPYSEGSPWFGQAPWPTWDAGKAAKSAADYLAETGRPLQFTLLMPDDPEYAPLGQLLVGQLDAAGMDVRLDVRPTDEVRTLATNGSYEAVILPLFGGGHPDEDAGLLYGKGISVAKGEPSRNIARFRSTLVDEALDKARATGDISKQADQYQKVQEQLAREAPYVFLCHQQGSVVAAKNVSGLTNWKLPDGSPGISQWRNTVALSQAWIAN